MKNHRFTGAALPALASALFLAATAHADEALTPPQFQDGDVVCFIGDSITHSRKFHRAIGDYYLTRFPQRKIRFINAGISGDSAGGALRRLSWDVLPHKPNVVSIMLGMNDVNRGLYGKANPDEKTLAAREAALTNYRRNMTQLVDTLDAALHPKFIFATPSPYDQTVQNDTENLFGVNEALAACGAFVTEAARARRAGVVDFHAPMTQMNLEAQKANPRFTLIGSDRVHPQEAGQLVMAYLYLKAQKLPATVSDFEIEADGRVSRSVNGTIENVRVEAGKISFDCKENALPFPVEAAAREALTLVPLEADFNQQRLALRLPNGGNYRLSVDGVAVGEFPAAQWKSGINLAMNPQMPQYQQAQNLLKISEQRRQMEARLRSFAQVKIMLDNAKINADDDAAVAAYFADFLAKLPSNQAYFKSQFENYSKTKPALGEIKDEIEKLTQQLWKLNQPVAHRYEISRVAAP